MNVNDKKIKLYIVTHKDCYIPKIPCFFPIQVGVALANKRIEGILHDDVGDNISERNRMYCELTAQYWVWKNDFDSDYVGFFHYRRYLNFSNHTYPMDNFGSVVYSNAIDDDMLSELGIEDENIKKQVIQNDIIVPVPRVIPTAYKNVYEQYSRGVDQYKHDLDCAIKVLLEKHPEYKRSVKMYLDTDRPYECNMFIMKTELFKEYAAWLFDILFEVENKSDFSLYNMNELRVMGFLAERLFGIWFIHNRDVRNLKTLELQKTMFLNTEKTLCVVSTATDSVVVVLACNNNYVPYTAVALKSIVENAKQNRRYEVYILTTDISIENQERLSNIFNDDKRFSFSCINIKVGVNKSGFAGRWHITGETFYRFYILSLFANTKKVLYLDCDLVINADVADLFDTELGDNYLAAAKDIDFAGAIKQKFGQRLYMQTAIGLDDCDEYFQAGVLLFNIPKMKEKADATELVNIYNMKKWFYMDQDILNHVYKGKIVYLPQSWNCIMNWKNCATSRMEVLKKAPFALYDEYMHARQQPKIVHFAGCQKPWNTADCDFAEYFWKYARKTDFYEEIMFRLCNPAKTSYVPIAKSWTEKLNGKSILIYGTGVHAKRLFQLFEENNVIGFLDKEKKDGLFLGKQILDWSQITPETADAIIIASRPIFYNEIFARIILLCLRNDLTVYFDDGSLVPSTVGIKEKRRFLKILDESNFDVVDSFVFKEYKTPISTIKLLNNRLVEKKIVIDDFVNNRIEAEKQVELYSVEKSIFNIYEILKMKLKLDEIVLREIKKEEVRCMGELFSDGFSSGKVE